VSYTLIRPTECQHPGITDEMLAEREILITRTAGDADSLKCPDCDEWLYPCLGCGVVCAGEPHHAGLDPRPDPATHPDYWSE
jgi:hypothetical protein